MEVEALKSVLFLIESLDGGGAEGVFRNIIKYIDKTKFDLHVVTEKNNELYTDFVASNSKYRSFIKNRKTTIGNIINKAIIKFYVSAEPKAVRKILVRGNYDIEVAFCEGNATRIIGASKNEKSRKIAWVHTDMINHPWSESVFGSAENEKACYEKFDSIACVSQTVAESFIKKYGMAEKVRVIYNIIDDELAFENAKEPCKLPLSNRPVFILAGRLEAVKGYGRLINVCSRLKTIGYSFSVIICGSGTLEMNLQRQIDELSLSETVFLAGFKKNPQKYMAAGDVFMCSSVAEGYSTVVAEAILLGKPVITTECSGMREIFGNSECGIICENNEDGIFNAMKDVLDNPMLLEKFSVQSKKRGLDFSAKKRTKTVEDFLDC